MFIIDLFIGLVLVISIGLAIYFFKSRHKVGILIISENFWDIFVEHGMHPNSSTIDARAWIEGKLRSVTRKVINE